MITDFQSSEIFINRLRIADAGSDPLATRLRAASLLNAADLGAAQVTPSAIVFIRKLRDPLPGVLRFDRSDPLPPIEWNQALSDSLRQFARRTIRPSIDNVTGSEEAILFANPAELLACLARDWCNSRVAERWWWRTLLRSGDISQFVKKVWRDHPESVPAALERLVRQRSAINFVRLLSPADLQPLVYQMIRSFALTELATIATRMFENTLASDPGGSQLNAGTRISSKQEEEWRPPVGPWRQQVPEAEAGELTLPQKFFIGIALMIARLPSVARSKEFAREVKQWQEQIESPSRQVSAPEGRAETLFTSSANPTGILEVASANAQLKSQPRRRLEEPGDSRIDDRKPIVVPALPPSTEPETMQTGAEAAFVDQPFEQSLPATREQSIAQEADKLQPQFSTPAEATISATEQPLVQPSSFERIDSELDNDAVWIETNLGGLFYLINLGLYLNLYADFTTPAAPGIELNIFDFVAVVGAELTSDALSEDPIWFLLANLAGRDEEEPLGSSFAPDDEWRLPPEWLSMFSDDRPWRWSTGRRRLRVLHPEGFLILDLPLAKDVRKQLQREIRRYDVSERSLSRGRMAKLSRLRTKVSTSPEVRHWLSLLMPYVRARLRFALGLEADKNIAPMLCQRYARVRATDTHVDVFFWLADLPLEIRFAGLDRDPGWVPAAGRFITFHFD